MSQTEKYDHMYLNIASECGDIRTLISSFVGFLLRRTDFFYEADPGDQMGFPPGVAEKIFTSAFRAAQAEYYKKHPKKSIEEYEKKQEQFMKQKAASSQLADAHKPAQPAPEAKPKAETPPAKKEEQAKPQPAKQGPVSVDSKFKDIPTYNGGVNSKYKWSQNLRDVSVQIPLKPSTRAKDITVQITPTRLRATYNSTKEDIVNGELFDSVKADDSTWLIDEGSLVLTLEKREENIWKTVIRGDEEIDTTKVDNSKTLADFDPETQGALRKIMYEQDRKLKGLPTTEEEQQQELLKRAWNAEGSPFVGQPFDPSRVNFPANQHFPPPN